MVAGDEDVGDDAVVAVAAADVVVAVIVAECVVVVAAVVGESAVVAVAKLKICLHRHSS